MTNISETQIASCRKVEEHLINHSVREVTKARSSTVMPPLQRLSNVSTLAAFDTIVILKALGNQ
jgi:hypothetical protein